MPVALAQESEENSLALDVIRLRYWQHVMNERLKEKRFKIPIHVGIGHEALAAAVSRAMGPHDQLVLSHRNMTYNLARAGALRPVYQEYLLAPDGVAGGRLGSMNLAQPNRGVAYASSILGNNPGVACGLAMANQVLGREALVICLTGDGAIEEGGFWESLVFARSQHLPLLFLVENNNQSMSSTIEERRCPIDLAKLCASIGMRFRTLEGNDVAAYAEAIRDERTRILTERTPACVEAKLKAFNQHAGPSPGWPTDPKRIDLKDGLLIEPSPEDPLFTLLQQLGEERFTSLCRQVMAEPLGV